MQEKQGRQEEDLIRGFQSVEEQPGLQFPPGIAELISGN